MKNIIIIAAVLSIATFGCKKKDTSTPAADPTPTTTGTTPVVIDINSVPQATFVLDGVSKSYVSNNNTIFGGSGSGSSGNDDYVYSSDIDDGNSITYLGISKGQLHIGGVGGPPTDAVFKAFFPVGNKSYSINAVNGIEISMFDAAGVEWSTSLGTGAQTGSTFSIDQTKDNGSQFGYYQKIKATFSCKLYDASGNVKVLTNGLYIGDFGNF